MNPPASAPVNCFIIEGLSTIRWGTDGFLKDAGLVSAIVNTVKQARRVSGITIENNAGFEAIQILLIQGQDYTINVVDDTAKTWPTTGAKINLQGPDDPTTLVFLCVEDDYDAAKKKEGTRNIKAKFYSAFTVS